MSITVIYNKDNTTNNNNITGEMNSSIVNIVNDDDAQIVLDNQNADNTDCIIVEESISDNDIQVICVVKPPPTTTIICNDVIDITNEETNLNNAKLKRKSSFSNNNNNNERSNDNDQKKRKLLKWKSLPTDDTSNNSTTSSADSKLQIDLLNIAFNKSQVDDDDNETNQEVKNINNNQAKLSNQIQQNNTSFSRSSPLPQLSIDCLTENKNHHPNPSTPKEQLQSNIITSSSQSPSSPLPQLYSQKDSVSAIKSQLTSLCETKRSTANAQSTQLDTLPQFNIPIYNYPRKYPTITIESGSLLNTQCEAVVFLNCIDTYGNISWNMNLTKYITNTEDIFNSYYRAKNMLLNQNTKTFDVKMTNSGFLLNKTNTRKLFHCHLQIFNYLSDFSEIHFKNSIQNILKLAIDNNIESIAIPAIGCDQLMYPSTFIVKWFDEVFKSFLLSYTCHSLKTIKVVLYDNDVIANRTFINFYYQKDITIMKPLDLNLSDEFQLSQLDPSSDEYRIAAGRFSETMRHAKIKSIEKVYNVHLEHMYEQSKTFMLKRVPANTSIEYNLFHGTTLNSINSICRFGFNRSYCGKNGTAFGQGVYFARDAIYSDKYSKSQHPNLVAAAAANNNNMIQHLNMTNQNNFNFRFNNYMNNPQMSYGTMQFNMNFSNGPIIQQQQQQPQQAHQTTSSHFSMILSRVLVGCYHKGTPQTKEPELRSNTHQYDSTVDDIQKPTIYVIYRDYRAYPNYIIHYN